MVWEEETRWVGTVDKEIFDLRPATTNEPGQEPARKQR